MPSSGVYVHRRCTHGSGVVDWKASSVAVDDESYQYKRPMKFSRRKRVHEGTDWTPDQMASGPQQARGLLCKREGKRKEWKRLSITYSLTPTCGERLWWCECGVLLKTDKLW